MPADIAGISGFLGRYAPAALNELRARHPEASAYLQPSGVPLGSGAQTSAAVDAAIVMLDTVDEVASTAMSETAGKLKAVRKLELGGSLLGLVTSGGVVGATLGFSNTIVAAGLGAVGFLASAVPLVTSWLRGVVAGKGAIDECFVKLRDLTWNARGLRAEFSRGVSEPDTSGLLKRANELAHNIYVVLSDLGYDSKIRPV